MTLDAVIHQQYYSSCMTLLRLQLHSNRIEHPPHEEMLLECVRKEAKMLPLVDQTKGTSRLVIIYSNMCTSQCVVTYLD